MSKARYPGEKVVDAGPLGQPLTFEFSKRSARNRFLKAAMTERLATWDPKDTSKRGVPTQEIINTYKWFGAGEVGVCLTGNIMIDPVNLEGPRNLVIPVDAPFEGARFEAWQELARGAKAKGSLMIGQVSHPGRQVQQRHNPQPISASDVQITKEIWGMKFAKPHAASHEEIREIVEAFAHAAEYLYRAGFDGIELHGAHGYLLSQFLSRRTNLRTDEYGGTIENRARIIAEIAAAVRARVPESTGFVLGIKLNSVEFDGKDFSPAECGDLCVLLEQNARFDFVELSGGTYEDLTFGHGRESTKRREAFFLEFADAIVPRLSHTKVYVTGGMRSVHAMLSALNTVDGIGLARPLCSEPDLPAKIIDGRVTTGAIRSLISDQEFARCNMAAGSQMQQLGNNQVPMDLTDEEVVAAFDKSMAKWAMAVAEHGDSMDVLGYPRLEGVSLPALTSLDEHKF